MATRTQHTERRAGVRGRTPRELPPPPRLQLATFAQRPPSGDGWLHEIKYDGYRIAATLAGNRVRLTTRNLLDWTHRFPAVAAAIAGLNATSAVLDGEIVAFDAAGRASFSALQEWLGRRSARGASRGDGAGARGSSSAAVVYQVFDLLELDGEDLTSAPLTERKARLTELLAAGSEDGRLRFTEHLGASGAEVYLAACRLRLEGVVSKRASAPYRAGRNDDWVKSTCLASDDFVIGGFTHPRGSRPGIGALLLGEYGDDGGLRYVGKVGTGLRDEQLVELATRLRGLARDASPFVDSVPRAAVSAGVTWVEPRLVAEVIYAERTRGGMVRQARFHSLREDKDGRPPVATTSEDGEGVVIAGVRLSNPDRVLYPEQGVTKATLAAYYVAVAEELLHFAAQRPLSLVRCPEGAEEQCFYQKHPGAGFAQALPRVAIEESEGVEDYLYLAEPAHLVALVQSGVLEVHAWNSRVTDLERPNTLVFDLDPSEGVELDYVKDTARLLRDLLDRLGLVGFLRATGGKGLHVVVPIVPEREWDHVKAFARGLAEAAAATDPERLTTKLSKQQRVGKVFIDYLRNSRGATAIVNYSTRSRPGAPVAVPLRWSELSKLASPAAYDVDSVRRRLSSLGSDPWEGFEQARRRLPSLDADEKPVVLEAGG